MAAGNMANRIGHREDCQSKRERYAQEPDADFGEGSRQDRAAAASKNEPESADRLGCSTLADIHVQSFCSFRSPPMVREVLFSSATSIDCGVFGRRVQPFAELAIMGLVPGEGGTESSTAPA